MATIVISYPAVEGATFNRDYYSANHMPMVHNAWDDLGLESTKVLYPASDSENQLAVTICVFRDAHAIEAALNSPRTGQVIGDTPNFTNVIPVLYRSNN